METQATTEQSTQAREVPFPSLAWFEELAARMNANRALHEKLGYIDCTVVFTVTDGGPGAEPLHYRVVFEEFAAVDVAEVDAAGAERADFALEADLAAWREMIESIEAGGGRPDLEHTLNRLSHMGTPFRVRAADPLCKDMYFRYNQSLQEFVNACGGFRTVFPAT